MGVRIKDNYLKIASISLPIILPLLTLSIIPGFQETSYSRLETVDYTNRILYVSLLSSIIAATIIRFELKARGQGGFWCNKSGFIITILSIVLIIGYLRFFWWNYETAMIYLDEYARTGFTKFQVMSDEKISIILRYFLFGLGLPSLSIVAVKLKEKRLFKNLLIICFFGYLIFPIYAAHDVFGVLEVKSPEIQEPLIPEGRNLTAGEARQLINAMLPPPPIDYAPFKTYNIGNISEVGDYWIVEVNVYGEIDDYLGMRTYRVHKQTREVSRVD